MYPSMNQDEPWYKKFIPGRSVRKAAHPYLLLAPAVLTMLLIIVLPMFRTIQYSFYNYKIWKPDEVDFIGLGNFIDLFNDAGFVLSFINTLKWLIIILFFQFSIGLLVALSLRRSIKLKGLIRGVLMVPWVTPSILSALMWKWMYHGDFGLINYLLKTLNIIPRNILFLTNPQTALYSCMVTSIWAGMPYFALMLTAGLASIPQEYYEAAAVDGSSKLQSFWHITLPGLKNVILITTLLRSISISNDIDIVYLMTGGGPAGKSMTLSVNAFITVQKGFDYGRASAMSTCLIVLLAIVSVLYIQFMSMGER